MSTCLVLWSCDWMGEWGVDTCVIHLHCSSLLALISLSVFLASLSFSFIAPWTSAGDGNSCMNASRPTGFTGKHLLCTLHLLNKGKNETVEWLEPFRAPAAVRDKCLWALCYSWRSSWTSTVGLLGGQDLRPWHELGIGSSALLVYISFTKHWAGGDLSPGALRYSTKLPSFWNGTYFMDLATEHCFQKASSKKNNFYQFFLFS